MSATIIDGRQVSGRLRKEVAREVADLVERDGQPPGLATIYVANKRKACAEVAIADHHRHLPADASQAAVASVIEECNADPEISGILLQLPVPRGLDGASLTALIAPEKDVDGLTPVSAGRLVQGTPGLRPCTPLGVIELL